MSAKHWLVKSIRRRKQTCSRVSLRRRRPMLELLEDRLNLTTLVGTANDDTLVVNATGPDSGTYILNGGPAVPFSGITDFQFDGLGGNDLLRINNPAGGLFAPSGGISYNGGGQAGDSLENLGGGATSGSYSVGPANGDGVLSHINGAVTQTISFTGLAPAMDTVVETTFTITANDAANDITLDDGTALGDGLLRVAINSFEPMQFANKTSIVVNAGGAGADGADTINVVYTEVSTGLSTVTFNADDGGDFILVRATPTGVTTTANGDSGDDVFLFDSNGFAAGGTLNGILGPVTVNGGDNTTLSTVSLTTGCGVTTTLALGDRVLFVDTDNTAGQSSVYSLSDTLFQRISNSPGGTATGPLSFATLERIDLLTGAGTDDILVSTTRDETTLIVNSGGGDDTVTVQNTGSGPAGAASIVFVDAQGGADTIDIQATGANSAVLAVGGNEDDVITFGNTGAAGRAGLHGGDGGDTLNVRGTGANSTTEVNGGGGNDTINLGSATNTLDTIQGEVCVDGQGNAGAPGDALTLNDAGALSDNTYLIDASTVTRAGVARVTFAGLERLALNAGQGSDTINVTPGVATTIDIDGNPPTPPASPGDTLDVDTTGTTNPVLIVTDTPSGKTGSYTFADRQPVNFQEIETLAGVPTVSVGDAAAAEGDPVVFTLTLSAPSTQQVTVRVNTTSGTATGDVDYNQINSFVDIVFPPGETTQTIAIQTFEDAIGEPDETFFLNVLQTTNAAVADGQGIGTINNDDISVSVDSNGKLTIEGTSDDDIVTITGIPPGVAGSGMYLVTTQQGSQLPQTQPVSGVTGDICVNLHAGHDQLTMNNAYVNGSIVIDMESGNDTVTLGNADVVSTRADLDVDLGTDNDVLNGKRIFIAGNQILVGGDGNDTMTFDGFASPFTLGTSAAGNANWSTGNGDDTVHVIYAFIVGAFAIDLGVGTDSLNIFGSAASGNVSFLGGTGIDSLTVDTNFFDANLLLDGGADNDTVFLANGLGTDVGTINTGAGANSVTIRNETTARLNIDTGTGADTVDVRSSALDRFFAILGEDDDQLTLFGNLLRLEADLDGGPGSADRLRDLGNDVRGAFRTRNFELFG
ncbi:MAG: Calx-beta domain-containing protein [Pirellulales bacterium]